MLFRVRFPRLMAAGIRYEKYESRRTNMFYEDDKKGGYRSEEGIKSYEEKSRLWHIRNGWQIMSQEFKIWKEEWKEKLYDDPVLFVGKNEIDVVWKFDGDRRSLDQWILTADSDHGEGFSSCSLHLTQAGKAIFSGYLDTRLPKTGNIKKAGYCNMRTLPLVKSFKRDAYYDWHMYNHLVMRVRGDGRSYLLNISTPDFHDASWNDIYHYALYTRGGPYWQWVKIPFSKFFLASKGRVQDKQEAIDLQSVSSFGISAGDKITGKFQLEIDYIGLLDDPSHTEEFAYESYETDRFTSSY